MADPKSITDRITELSGLARTAWASLLTAVLFIGVTLVSLKHSEFLVAGENVALPVINLSMPTRMFFFCAPVLLAVLYVNLHNYLSRLWKTFEIAPPDRAAAPGVEGFRLADAVPTWMGNDLALSLRPENRPHGSQWERHRNLLARFLFWWLAPAVLLYGWYRFLPARDPLLTLVILACLAVMAAYGGRSRIEALVRLARRDRDRLTRSSRDIAGASLVLLTLASGAWIIAPTGLKPYADRFDRSLEILSGMGAENTVGMRRAAGFVGLTIDVDRGAIAPARGISSAEDSFETFRTGWCKEMGLGLDICGTVPGVSIGATNTAILHRRAYCQRAENRPAYLRPADCGEYFDFIDARLGSDWDAARRAELARLPRIDLTGRDLIGASAEGSELSRVDFTGANLTGANLPWALLEGATLQRANLTDLWAYYADFSRANFTDARMTNANLERSDLSGAALIRADLRGANLSGVNLVGADLSGADLRGAKLNHAKLHRARLDATVLFDTDLTNADGLTPVQLATAIGEAPPPEAETGGTRLPRQRELSLLPLQAAVTLSLGNCFPGDELPDVLRRGAEYWPEAKQAEWKAMLCDEQPEEPRMAATGLTTPPASRRVEPYPRAPFAPVLPATFGASE